MKHFVRFAYLAVFSLTLTSPALAGDADGGIEVGTLFGGSRYADDYESLISVALPGAPVSTTGIPSLYISRFLTEQQLSFGSEFSFGKVSAEGNNFTSIFPGTPGHILPPGPCDVWILPHGARCLQAPQPIPWRLQKQLCRRTRPRLPEVVPGIRTVC